MSFYSVLVLLAVLITSSETLHHDAHVSLDGFHRPPISRGSRSRFGLSRHVYLPHYTPVNASDEVSQLLGQLRKNAVARVEQQLSHVNSVARFRSDVLANIKRAAAIIDHLSRS